MPEEPTGDPTADAAEPATTSKPVTTEKPAKPAAKAAPAKKSAATTKSAGTKKAEEPKQARRADPQGPLISPLGMVSAALAVVCVAAVVLITLMGIGHRDENAELSYRTDVLEAAAQWTATLINLNPENAEGSLQTLRDGTVGQLNADFDTTIGSFLDVLRRLEASTQGQVQSVAIESLRHDPDAAPGAVAPAPTQQPELAAYATRTDTVIVVATSVSQNVASGDQQPQPIRWNLRLDVSEVDGRLLISRLEQVL